MVNARNVSGWAWSVSILGGMSPKITYNCGECGRRNQTRLSMTAITKKRAYTVCAHCGEVNDTRLRYN